MKQEEQWANEVLNSLNTIKRARPSEQIINKIESIIDENENIKIIPLTQLKWIAAAAITIIALNIYALNIQDNTSKNQIEFSENNSSLLSDYTFYQDQ